MKAGSCVGGFGGNCVIYLFWWCLVERENGHINRENPDKPSKGLWRSVKREKTISGSGGCVFFVGHASEKAPPFDLT